MCKTSALIAITIFSILVFAARYGNCEVYNLNRWKLADEYRGQQMFGKLICYLFIDIY